MQPPQELPFLCKATAKEIRQKQTIPTIKVPSLVVVILLASTGEGYEFVVKIFTVCTREQVNGSF